jgi:hypothetical protein
VEIATGTREGQEPVLFVIDEQGTIADSFATLARELRPSRSRPRIALQFGAVGA